MNPAASDRLPGTAAARPAGAGNDRALPRRPRWRRWALAGLAGTATLFAMGAALWHTPAPGSTQAVALSQISIAAVQRGRFEDTLALRAVAQPAVSVFLDTVEGGRVERVLAEDGAEVAAGQLLAVLSNAGLQMEMLSREAQVLDQLNQLRAQELQLERSRIDNQVRVAELEFRTRQLALSGQQQSELARSGFVSTAALQRNDDELAMVRSLLDAARANQQATERLQAAQLEQLRRAAQQMQAQLDLARRHGQALELRAPAAGRLTAFALEVGQSVARGARVGQVDEPRRFKLSAGVDQHYLARLTEGQRAELEHEGRSHALQVSKIYPQVQNGEFRIDLAFVPGAGGTAGAAGAVTTASIAGAIVANNAAAPGESAAAPTLRRGQTLSVRLQLGEPVPALLLPAGPFLQESGGAFAFVVDATGGAAARRAVRLGRRNAQQVEVLEGLAEGERVVTSSYADLQERTRLRIDTDR